MLGFGVTPDLSKVYASTALDFIPNNVFNTNVVTPGVVIVVGYFRNLAIFSGLYMR